MGFGVVRDKEEIGEVAAEARGDVGPQYLHRNGGAHAVTLGFAAMHLRDRGCGNRRTELRRGLRDRKSTRLNSSHDQNSYAVFCLKKKKKKNNSQNNKQKKKKKNPM